MGEIIWLSSYPKSGNTWTRAFLHNLLLDPDEPTRINTIDAFCLGESDAQHFNQIDPRPLTTLTDKEVAEIRPKVHHMLTRAFPDSVFVKTHNYLGEWQGVPLVTMECTAGAIYILRNPLDVAISFAHHFGISIDAAIEQMANPSMGTPTTDTNVRQIYASWSINVKSWTQHAHPQIHVAFPVKVWSLTSCSAYRIKANFHPSSTHTLFRKAASPLKTKANIRKSLWVQFH